MPYKRGKYAKRGRRRRRPMYRRRLKAKPSLNYHKYRLTDVIDVKTDNSGTTFPGSVCYFFKHHDPVKTVIQHSSNTAVGSLSNIPDLSNLYDMYRIQYIRLKYTPKYDRGANLSDGSFLQGQPAGYISSDPDNVSLRQTIDQLVQKPGARRLDMSRPWTYRFKPKRVSQSSVAGVQILGNGWVNLQSAKPIMGEIQLSTDAWVKGSSGGPSVPAVDESIGQILIEYYVELKSRK